ncbi:hypothetical protein [Myxosarcina sp. GI1]|uniref:hypothetical protein n=1 Tax=Myxosarcina sp. GI1 TaxID=1541065 RepID=UPI0012E0ACEE|nr:hypothetical protein [Myxosarcina sp. GI1]
MMKVFKIARKAVSLTLAVPSVFILVAFSASSLAQEDAPEWSYSGANNPTKPHLL